MITNDNSILSFISTSPLEQFRVKTIFSLGYGYTESTSLFFGWITYGQLKNLLSLSDFSITNSLLPCIIGFFLFVIYTSGITVLDREKKKIFDLEKTRVIPNRFQIIFDMLFLTIINMIKDIIGKAGNPYTGVICVLFYFILFLNLFGMLPFCFCFTSQICVTLWLAIAIFIALNIICIRKHGINFFSFFLPSGSSIVLALLLVPIEIVSYFFRPISLSVRLFANMMAGHTLLKVIAGFAWSLSIISSSWGFFAHLVPLFVILFLMCLEFGVALIQAYVFTILTCIYLSDAINLH